MHAGGLCGWPGATGQASTPHACSMPTSRNEARVPGWVRRDGVGRVACLGGGGVGVGCGATQELYAGGGPARKALGECAASNLQGDFSLRKNQRTLLGERGPGTGGGAGERAGSCKCQRRVRR